MKAEWILKFLLMNGIGLKILSIKKKFRIGQVEALASNSVKTSVKGAILLGS
jgi:hypothetical protein